MIIATSAPKKWKIFAELIKWYQKTTFSHVLILDGDLVYQASHFTVNVFHIEQFILENRIITIYELPDHSVDMGYVKRQLGKRYGMDQILNLFLLIFFKIRRKDNGDQRFICSEIVGKALGLTWVNDYTTPKEIDAYLRSVSGGK